jgi:HK97 family phage portal protein
VLNFAGRTIGLSNATDAEALSTLQTGGKLKGIISSESSLTGFGSAIDVQVDTIRDNMQAEIDSGKDIITLQSGAEFKPISQTMRDLQLVDLHQVTLSDLARYFGVSLAKLGINLGGNYMASLHDSLNFYMDTLNPLLKKIEAAFNAKLIQIPKKYKIEFDRTTLTYFKELLTNYEKMMNLGLCTVNDIRRTLNMPEVEGGDNVFVTTNTQPLAAPKVDPLLQQPEEQQPEINNTENNDDNNGDS